MRGSDLTTTTKGYMKREGKGKKINSECKKTPFIRSLDGGAPPRHRAWLRGKRVMKT